MEYAFVDRSNTPEVDERLVENRSITIKVDFREDNSQMGEILTLKYGINVVREELRVGDYVIANEIVIERKTTLDFAQSIIDGRLFKQAAKMKQFFSISFFIIEGNNFYNTSIDIHPHAIKGALVSLMLMWHIPVLFAEDVNDTALFLWLMGTQNADFYRELTHRPGRRPKRFYKKQLYILQGLPQVGPKLALQLLEHFGSVEKVVTASEDELIQVHGLGKTKAQKIRGILSEGRVPNKIN